MAENGIACHNEPETKAAVQGFPFRGASLIATNDYRFSFVVFSSSTPRSVNRVRDFLSRACLHLSDLALYFEHRSQLAS